MMKYISLIVVFAVGSLFSFVYAQRLERVCDIERSGFLDDMRRKLTEVCGSDNGLGWGDSRYFVIQDIFAHERRGSELCIDANRGEMTRLSGVIDYYRRGEMPKDYMDMGRFVKKDSPECKKFLIGKFGERSEAQRDMYQKTNPQQIGQSSLSTAQKNIDQAEAAAAKRGKRTHNRLAEAHQCLRPDVGGLYGGFTNSCPFQVDYEYCTTGTNSGAWGSMMECRKGRIGADSVGANRQTTDLLNGAQMVYWFACKYPYKAVGATFDPAKGITSRCVEWPR